MQQTNKEFFDLLEAEGESAVRAKFTGLAYGDKRPLVEEWFRIKDAARHAPADRANYRMSALAAIVALIASIVAALMYLAKTP